MSDIDKVISNGYCIGCGSCQVENNVKTLENDYGMYYPDIEDISKLNNKACPFSNTSENEIEFLVNYMKIMKTYIFINILDIIYHYMQDM